MENCAVCSKSFQTRPRLREHLKKIHLFDVENIRALVPRKKKVPCKYICSNCSRGFNISSHFRWHMRNVHKLLESETESYRKTVTGPVVKCPLCSNEAHERDMAQHFKVDHGITLEIDNLEFDNCDTFFQWKKKIERSTSCKFILKRNKEKRSHVYICHRSGEFKSRGKGLRLLKFQGSKKMGAYCPAAIHLKIFNDKCYAKFIETHIGHDNELYHINLSPTRREEIAKKLYLNIPKKMILDEVRESDEGQLGRIHLLTMKDLHNISRDYDISPHEMKNLIDSASVNEFIREMQCKENNPVLYYKPQDCTDTANPFLKYSDFVLIIMNDVQKEMLSIYGKNVICFDGTDGMDYEFILYTIVVLDSVNEGFPCCFLITNRADEAMFTFLFTKIKNTIAKLNESSTEINVLMSGMEKSLIKAWIDVMGKPKRQLFCTWHVDGAWKHNLMEKINDCHKHKQVYRMLRILLEEMDENKFKILLQDTVASLKTDPDTNDFARYFVENYLCDAEAWAYCHRTNSELNLITHLESMHHTLKYVYMEGKNVKRLDKIICLLMRLIRDNMFDQMIIKKKKIAEIRKRHQTATKETNLITYDNSSCKWIVSSKKLYYIERNEFDCKCHLICTACKSCIHNYTCTCIDYTVKGNMCKHIHQVCMIVTKEKDDDLDDRSPGCENLIPLPAVKETLPNSQHKKEFESAVIEEINEGNRDMPIEFLENKFNELVDSVKTNKQCTIALSYLNKAIIGINSDNMVHEQTNNNTNHESSGF